MRRARGRERIVVYIEEITHRSIDKFIRVSYRIAGRYCLRGTLALLSRVVEVTRKAIEELKRELDEVFK